MRSPRGEMLESYIPMAASLISDMSGENVKEEALGLTPVDPKILLVAMADIQLNEMGPGTMYCC